MSAIAYANRWPNTGRALWEHRHVVLLTGDRTCPTCGHSYRPGRYRIHLSGEYHRMGRGWWRRHAVTEEP